MLYNVIITHSFSSGFLTSGAWSKEVQFLELSYCFKYESQFSLKKKPFKTEYCGRETRNGFGDKEE